MIVAEMEARERSRRITSLSGEERNNIYRSVTKLDAGSI